MSSRSVMTIIRKILICALFVSASQRNLRNTEFQPGPWKDFRVPLSPCIEMLELVPIGLEVNCVRDSVLCMYFLHPKMSEGKT